MKKTSTKKTVRDKITALNHRTQKKFIKKITREKKNPAKFKKSWKLSKRWINNAINKGLLATIDARGSVTITLPEKMNFSSLYETTTLALMAIRRLTDKNYSSKKSYKLISVNFDNLTEISTSAALVLTAELSKWDDSIRARLKANIENWNKDVLKRFFELGFFELFQSIDISHIPLENKNYNLKQVKYIKGMTGDVKKRTILKNEICNIIGKEVEKWNFLSGGLSEAITNVTHHAYPNNLEIPEKHKNWYLSGSFDKSKKELKIVFYDQGIGIPNSLPTSKIWEKILEKISLLPIADRKKDEMLLKAAVSLDRTSTGDLDRGKGLQDLLEFIRQRGSGYISILSQKGLYKFTIVDGNENVKTFPFEQGLYGTLIIWCVDLN